MEQLKAFYYQFSHFLGLGLEGKELSFVQICVRGFIVFVVTLVIIRLGDKRFLSKKTAFDAVLGFILASMMARAVNGTAAFFPTLGGGFVLVMLHRFMAWLAMRHHGFGNLIKGTAETVIENGRLKEDVLRSNNFSEHDLQEDLRMNGSVTKPEQVKEARIERNGDVSVVKR